MHDLAALTARLEALETERRRTRRWLSAGAVALLLCGGLSTIAPVQGQDAGSVVEATQFVLQTQGGKRKAQLMLGKNDTPNLVLYDDAGKPRTILGLARDGTPTFSMLNAEGEVRVAFGLDGDGSAIALRDANGKKRLGLSCSDDGVPGLIFQDSSDTTRLSLGVSGKGVPNLALQGPGGSKSVILSSVGEHGTPAFLLYDKDGKVDRKLSLIGSSK